MFIKRKRKEEETGSYEVIETNTTEQISYNLSDDENLVVTLEQLPLSYNKERLVKIDSKEVIASLSSLTNVSTTLVTNKAMLNSIKQIRSSNLYKVKLPAGAKLVNSREIKDNYRGFFRDSNHIRGHANLEQFNYNDVTKGADIATKVGAVMAISSLLVGQYYMNEINNKFISLSNDINKISGFQDREYQSKIYNLIHFIQISSKYSDKLIMDRESKNRQLSLLDGYFKDATQLLNQANLTILENLNKNSNFKDYEAITNEIDKYLKYQQTLLIALTEMTKLNHILSLGMDNESYFSEISLRHINDANSIKSDIVKWHKHKIKLYEIDLKNKQVTKKNIQGLISKVTSIIDDKYKYTKLDDNFIRTIKSQLKDNAFSNSLLINPYEVETEIVYIDNEYYYVPAI